METLRDDGTGEAEEEGARGSRVAGHAPGDAVTVEGFNLHAAVTLRADDDTGREHLARYISRPPFALARIGIRRDGNVTYRVKKVGRGRARCRVMTPLEFMGRLAAIVAPPRFPLLRYHGVLAPRHIWRDRIVPKPRVRTANATCGEDPPAHKPRTATAERPKRDEAPPWPDGTGPARDKPSGDGSAAFNTPAADAPSTKEYTRSGLAEHLATNVLSVQHWARLLDGELYAPLGRMEWATLLN